MLKIIEKPNDFVKNSKNDFKDGELNRSQNERLYFWDEFNKVLIDRKKPFNIRKPSTKHWYDISIGSNETHIVNKFS